MAATASYLQALVNGGEWLLRIDDIDPPREPPGTAENIVRCLDLHGFQWQDRIRWQSSQRAVHTAAVEYLLDNGLAYWCDCSRSEIRAIAERGTTGPVYPGTCRNRRRAAVRPIDAAVRVRTAPAQIHFRDRCQGEQLCRIDRQVGDFVIRRRDGLMTYILATALDDHAQAITEVVRGADLVAITPAQMWLQRLLGLREPAYLHVPVVRNRDGQKLSKQTGAQPIDCRTPGLNLCSALHALGQTPPAELQQELPTTIWHWARRHWDPGRTTTGTVGADG